MYTTASTYSHFIPYPHTHIRKPLALPASIHDHAHQPVNRTRRANQFGASRIPTPKPIPILVPIPTNGNRTGIGHTHASTRVQLVSQIQTQLCSPAIGAEKGKYQAIHSGEREEGRNQGIATTPPRIRAKGKRRRAVFLRQCFSLLPAERVWTRGRERQICDSGEEREREDCSRRGRGELKVRLFLVKRFLLQLYTWIARWGKQSSFIQLPQT